MFENNYSEITITRHTLHWIIKQKRGSKVALCPSWLLSEWYHQITLWVHVINFAIIMKQKVSVKMYKIAVWGNFLFMIRLVLNCDNYWLTTRESRVGDGSGEGKRNSCCIFKLVTECTVKVHVLFVSFIRKHTNV